MSLHSAQTANHRLESWVYADATARLAATGFAVGDMGKIAYQTDTGSYYRLVAVAPLVWENVTGRLIPGPGLPQMEPFRYDLITSLVGMGDSITYGAGASDAAHRWLNLLQGHINTATANTSVLTNLGVSGERTQGMARRLIGTERRGVVVILGGLNDMRAGIPVPAIIDNLAALLDYYQPTADLIVVGSTPHIADYTNVSYAPYNVGSDAAAHMLNAAILSLCQQRGVLFADVHTAMAENDALVGSDGIHPNDAGHGVIANAFWSVLAPYFSSNAPLVVRRPLISRPYAPLPNPHFGDDITYGWSAYQGTISKNTAVAMAGQTTSALLTVTTDPGAIYSNNTTGSGVAWPFPGVKTLVEAWVMAHADTPSVSACVRTNEYTAANAFINGSTVTGSDATCTSSGWTRIANVITPTSTCAALQINVVLHGLGSKAYVGYVRAYALNSIIATV